MFHQPSDRLPFDGDAFDAALENVLGDPPFREHVAPGMAERFSDWLGTLWRTLGWSDRLAFAAHPGLFWSLLGSVLGLSAWLGYRLWASWQRRRPSTPEAPGTVFGALAAPGSAFGSARSALADGDTRRAVEALWQEVAALGEASSGARLTPRQTVRLLESRVSAASYEPLRQVYWAHERACYAGQPPSHAEVSALLDSLLLLWQRPLSSDRTGRLT
jgi:hypothetical protein